MTAQKSPPRRPRTKPTPRGDGSARRKRPAAGDGAADARFALVLSQVRPAAAPIAGPELSQAEAWAAEPDWDDLTVEEQIAHLEADEAELHRRIEELRSKN